MVYFTAVLVKWAHRSSERVGFSLVIFVLSMMTSMLVSAVIYFTRPDLFSLEIGAGLSFTVMTLGCSLGGSQWEWVNAVQTASC